MSTSEREVPTRLLYRNPLEILLAEEARTCKGCQHEEVVFVVGQQNKICANGKKHGNKCRSYSESR